MKDDYSLDFSDEQWETIGIVMKKIINLLCDESEEEEGEILKCPICRCELEGNAQTYKINTKTWHTLVQLDVCPDCYRSLVCAGFLLSVAFDDGSLDRAIPRLDPYKVLWDTASPLGIMRTGGKPPEKEGES